MEVTTCQAYIVVLVLEAAGQSYADHLAVINDQDVTMFRCYITHSLEKKQGASARNLALA